MVIKNFKPFVGQHCETTATGSLLQQLGVNLSEPMLFGIGEGLGFIYWNMKAMDFPFIGGRVKPDTLTHNICNNLNLKLEVQETTSQVKAWNNVKKYLDQGIAVGLKLDCFHLEYFASKIHFAGHYASIYGYDEKTAYLNDTNQQGRDARTSLESLALARNERGPMSSRNRSYTISKQGELPDMTLVVRRAIGNNAKVFLNPPIKNIGYKGILKASVAVKRWFETSNDVKRDFQTTAMLMERAGTGGALFRNLYRDFLRESAAILQDGELDRASNQYGAVARLWTQVSELFHEAGEAEDVRHINSASQILADIAKSEQAIMEKLVAINK